jgi:predicted nucleic acid-binding protein
VLLQAPLRDLLIELAQQGSFRARWTETIHDEWIESLLAKNPTISRDKLNRTRRLMNSAVRDCLVAGFESLIPTLALPDQNDRHVLAAAIHGSANVIVTSNLVDFPVATLTGFGIEAQHPDAFLVQMFRTSQTEVCDAVKRIRQRLRNPPKSAQEYLQTLSQLGLTETVTVLQPLVDQI